MADFVAGLDRGRATLLPECLGDWVDESNPVQAADVFVDALELRHLGFGGADPAATSRPGYHPPRMLKLYIYGHLNRVQSSRRVEREAGRKLGSDVADRAARSGSQNHRRIPQGQWSRDQESLRALFCLVPQDGPAGESSVAIDGSKFKAVNSRDNNFTEGKIQHRQKQIEESVARYMSQLDTTDRESAEGKAPSETVQLTKTRLREMLSKLEVEVKRLAGLETAFARLA